MRNRKHPQLVVPALFLAVFAAGFAGGLVFNGKNDTKTTSENKFKALRLDGYNLISPLLTCDASVNERAPELNALENKLNTMVGSESQADHIKHASVYFRDFSTGNEITVNSDEKYYPASLNKIPVMIAYFKIAETNPGILSKEIKVEGGPDTNAAQEIKPKDYLRAGRTYTVERIIELMIKYSDNNALALLTNYIDQDTLQSVYNDLGLYFPEDLSKEPEFITVKDFSYFLRVLYNSTYLQRDLSEKALKILSEVDFKDGLVAGVSENTVVSHKFGIKTEKDNSGVAAKRELHDCGIIYHPDRPYLLCIMTKSEANLPEIEQTIKSISSLVYQEVDRNYQQ
ncbi:MAG: hypothetical protein BWY68_00388 [bacterium ADurb.Bin400]|nr:MAG: hypothetical protein BWY68_00388 [bacterium ADurb.Bin400]